MKILLLACTLFIASTVTAQPDLPSGVFHWSSAGAEKTATGETRQMVNGSTTDLSNFKVHTSTLEPGKTNHQPQAYNDVEELVVVKDGLLTLIIKDSSKTIGAGGMALIVAGDEQSFRNTSAKPVTYYILAYKSKNPVNIARGQQGGGTFIKDWKDFMVKKTDKGESRPVFDRPSSMFERFDVHATALDPGFASHDPHHHRAEEVILLLKGDVDMQIGQSFYKATAGDIVFLASESLHALKNTGREQCGYFAIQWHNRKED